MKIRLYQTLENKENPEEVDDNGPFLCNSKTAWLGFGYYFWDTHIILAHQWGKTVHEGTGYFICEAYGVLDETCWDLSGNGMHREHFKQICDEIVNKGIAKKDKLTVAYVIQYLKKKCVFNYKAIRANAIGGFTKGFGKYDIKFKLDKKAYMEIYPNIQVCLVEKRALSLHNFHIVYPEFYMDSQYA